MNNKNPKQTENLLFNFRKAFAIIAVFNLVSHLSLKTNHLRLQLC